MRPAFERAIGRLAAASKKFLIIAGTKCRRRGLSRVALGHDPDMHLAEVTEGLVLLGTGPTVFAAYSLPIDAIPIPLNTR
jgi:hypothetical protein